MAMATLGLTAWVSLIGARSYYVEGMHASMKRRVAYMNARAATEQYLYYNALTKESAAAATITFDLPGGEASIEVPEMTDAPLASTRLAGAVRTSPGNGFSYAVEVPVTATISIDDDGDSTTAKVSTVHKTDYWLRSRSQLLAGDLASIHVPGWWSGEALTFGGQFRIEGNVQTWPALAPHNIYNSPRAETFSTPTVADASLLATDRVKRINGTWGPQRNYASVPITSGDFSGSSNAYLGKIDIVNSGRSWSLVNKVLDESHDVLSGSTPLVTGRGAESDGSGTVDVTLDHHLGTNLLIGNGTTTLNLHGQDDPASFAAAAGQRAIMIVVNQTSNTNRLSRLNFIGQNNRPLLLAVRRVHTSSWVHYAFLDANPSTPVEWRMLWVNENTRMWNRPDVHNNGNTYSGGQPLGTVILKGGILTDRRFSHHNNGGRLFYIQRDTNPALWSALLPGSVGWRPTETNAMTRTKTYSSVDAAIAWSRSWSPPASLRWASRLRSRSASPRSLRKRPAITKPALTLR